MSSNIIVKNKKIIRRLVKEIPSFTVNGAREITFDEESVVGEVFGRIYGFDNIDKLKGVEREFYDIEEKFGLTSYGNFRPI